jgi:hypothetical protein
MVVTLLGAGELVLRSAIGAQGVFNAFLSAPAPRVRPAQEVR